MRTKWGGQLAAHWGRRLAAVAITIFAIAGTLSGCGRYGSPVRVAPVESVSPTETLDSDVIDPAADESSDRKDADHETDRTNQTD